MVYKSNPLSQNRSKKGAACTDLVQYPAAQGENELKTISYNNKIPGKEAAFFKGGSYFRAGP